MKKEYIQPRMKAMSFKTAQMLCGSFPVKEGGTGETSVDVKENILTADDLDGFFSEWD